MGVELSWIEIGELLPTKIPTPLGREGLTWRR